MSVLPLTARLAARLLRGTPHYGYGQAPGYTGNTEFGAARFLITTGGERYYLQGELTADGKVNSYFPNLYGGIVPLQASYARINDALRELDRVLVGEVYQLSSAPFVAAIDRPVVAGGLSAAIMPLPATHEAYRAAIGDKSRNMVRKPEKNGFTIREFDKNAYLDDLYAIHTSLDVRQGQPLADAYRAKLYANYRPRAAWELIRDEWWGAFTPEGRLVGYVFLPGANGEYLTSRIMGHGDFLRFGIMNALVDAIVAKHAGERGHIMYGMYEHGTDGLRRFKDSMGFVPVPCVRYAFGPGNRVGAAVVGTLRLSGEWEPKRRLRELSKKYPGLRGNLLTARAAVQRALKRK